MREATGFALPLAVLAACQPTADEPASARRLTHLVTAQQLGPVGYRDPVGALSPDGAWFAYAVEQRLFVLPSAGGLVRPLAAGGRAIRYLVWFPDSRRVAVEERGGSSAPHWWVHDRDSGARSPLFATDSLTGRTGAGAARRVAANALRYLSPAPGGDLLAAVEPGATGRPDALWLIPFGADSGRVREVSGRVGYLSWTPGGELACLVASDGRQQLTLPCGGPPLPALRDREAYGAFAFDAGGLVHFGSPNPTGTLDLWSVRVRGAQVVGRTRFSRDTYAASVGPNGEVAFTVQDYRTHVAMVAAEGGETRPITTFQSETPSWDPTGTKIGITYGSWRRVIDDFHYPDIAQDLGIVAVTGTLPASAPTTVVDTSDSEDQGLGWSPDGRWIAYHSHQDLSDDVWLVPADRSAPERRITFLGRGAEAGWPRWSPDGRWIVVGAEDRAAGRSAIFVMGVDPATGAVTDSARPIGFEDLSGDALHAEWLPDGRSLVVHAFAEPDSHAVYVGPAIGGRARPVHRWRSDHRFSGIGVSPDGQWVAIVARAPDGYFQMFRVPIRGGAPEQLTFDPNHKTQPAYSPDGRAVAFTVWRYEGQFWLYR
jgi:Tol biopolymer transport system component